MCSLFLSSPPIFCYVCIGILFNIYPVKIYIDGQELEEEQIVDATSTLTRTQAAAVKKRIEKLNDTLRKKRIDGGSSTNGGAAPVQGRTRGDVRDLFPSSNGEVSGIGMLLAAMSSNRTTIRNKEQGSY